MLRSEFIDDLKILSELPGAPGYEEPVANYIKLQLDKKNVEWHSDRLGNVVCRVKGRSQNSSLNTLHLDAHMDEPAFMVKYIADNGLVYVTPIGYFIPETVLGQRVKIITSFDGTEYAKGTFCVKSFHGGQQSGSSAMAFDDIWIDVGAASANDVREMGVKPGASVVFDASFSVLCNDRVMGKAFDDRGGCAVLLDAIDTLLEKQPFNDVVFSFSVQEEFLLRGICAALDTIKEVYNVSPKVSLCLDIATCGEVAGGGFKSSPIKMGAGFGIKLRDKSGVSQFSHVTSPRLVSILEGCAVEANIPFQYDFLAGCTNADIIPSHSNKIYAGGLSYATRNTHSPVEIVDLRDMQYLSDFIVAIALKEDCFSSLI